MTEEHVRVVQDAQGRDIEQVWDTTIVEDEPIMPSDDMPAPRTTRRVQGYPPPQEKGQAKKPTGKKTAVDWTEQLNGIVQLVASPFITIGLMSGNRVMVADGVTIGEHGPRVMAGVNQLAQTNPTVAGALERLTQIGPYGVILEPLFLMAVQIATNHRQELLRVTDKMGAKSLDQLVGSQEEFAASGNGSRVPQG